MDVQFIISILSKIATSFEGVATFCALVTIKKYYNIPILRFFPIVLLYTLANEIAGQFFYSTYNNVLIYNILSLITSCYFLSLFTKYYTHRQNSKITISLMILVLITFAGECVMQGVATKNFNVTYIVGGVSLIISSILYLIEKLQSSEILQIKHDLMFWISVGNLLFYVGYIPIKITRYYFTSSTHELYILKGIHLFLVIILYSSYTLGLIWVKKKEL